MTAAADIAALVSRGFDEKGASDVLSFPFLNVDAFFNALYSAENGVCMDPTAIRFMMANLALRGTAASNLTSSIYSGVHKSCSTPVLSPPSPPIPPPPPAPPVPPPPPAVYVPPIVSDTYGVITPPVTVTGGDVSNFLTGSMFGVSNKLVLAAVAGSFALLLARKK